MIRFNSLLEQVGLEPSKVTILLHTPSEKRLARMLPLLAETEPGVFNAFQSVHSRLATATLRGRPFVASFVRVDGGTLALAGIFKVVGVRERPMKEVAELSEVRRLVEDFGTLLEFSDPAPGETWTWFDLELTDFLAPLLGRLQIRPVLTQTYVRLADRLAPEVIALSAASVLNPAMPDWKELALFAADLRTLPQSWRTILSQWRGVYLITDQSDGARYVGSAYNQENLLGRWSAHVAGPTGITAGLRNRQTRNFRFSILELLAPTADASAVIEAESSWKDRLQTRKFGLNEN